MKTILKVIVGSQAHGLATPESDFDYRGVFVNPTSEIFKIGGTTQQTNWIEGKEDDTSWELGHFLFLATKCNPTILETFLAPLASDRNQDFRGTEEGDALRLLFPYVWNSKAVKDAFMGYGFNQRKKFLEDKDKRAAKYAAAYLRTLYQAWELLTTNTFTVRIIDTEIGQIVKKWKFGDFSVWEVMQVCTDWQAKVEQAYEKNPDKQADLDKINEFLLEIRRNNW